MNHTESGLSRAVSLASIVAVGAFILILFPTLISGVWKLVAWVVTAASAVSVGILHNLDKSKKEAEKKSLR